MKRTDLVLGMPGCCRKALRESLPFARTAQHLRQAQFQDRAERTRIDRKLDSSAASHMVNERSKPRWRNWQTR